MFASFFHVPHRLVLYAQGSARDLLVLGILLLLLIPTLFISKVDPAETVKAE